jgi:hypothetical protein
MSALAIIVPAGPGDSSWQSLLPRLEPAAASDVVLVQPDGEPFDAGAVPTGVRRITTRAGRAFQLNAGAAATDASWLWFLHCDSRPVAATFAALRRFVELDLDALGYFDLRFLDDGPRWMAINRTGAWWRSRLLGLPFGDQGFVLPRRVFDTLGRFDEHLHSGEDHALVWAARRHGIPTRALRAPLYTSARKYAELGWWSVTRRHLGLTWSQARSFARRRSAA